MTIDERLDRLVQRHEALTESVQMLLDSHREHEERSEKQFAQHQQQFAQHQQELAQHQQQFAQHQQELAQHQRELAQHQREFAQHEQLFGQIALRLREVTNGIDRLARVAGVHQERLDDHEQRMKDLERGPHP